MATFRKQLVAVEAAPAPNVRKKLVDMDDVLPAASYFADPADKADNEDHFSSGCAILDAVLGGGYVLGRITNIIGTSSSGKTLLAIEACANFHKKFPKGYIRYSEAEAAFDQDYAKALGMPIEAVDFEGEDKNKEMGTVEEFYDDIVASMDAHKNVPMLYVLDSLDALSDKAESERKIGDNSYGGTKAKKMGELFRRLVKRMEDQKVCVVIISQVRDKLNVSFGETKTRSGGRALDFYASQILWLDEIEKMKRMVGGIERIVGIKIRGKTKKNKVGINYRQCDYPILFGYGIDDLTANVEWLIENKCDDRLAELQLSKAGYKIRLLSLRNKGGNETRDLRALMRKVVFEEWARIEKTFLSPTSKYD